MPEIVIKYSNSKTLEALKAIAQYFDFSISDAKPTKSKNFSIKGVSVIPANSSVDTSDLEALFTNKHLDAKALRTQAWERKK